MSAEVRSTDREVCEACERGEHFLCGRQSWCQCKCEGAVEPCDLPFEGGGSEEPWWL